MPTPPLPKLRSEVAATARRLHQLGWVANHDGNVSVRLTGDRWLITPTAVSKGSVEEDLLLIVDAKGAVLEGRRKPFSELELHFAAYQARNDIECVIHAHPPHATAFGLAGVPLAPLAMPEVVVSLGAHIPTVSRHLPKTEALTKAVGAACTTSDAMLLSGNGALTLGQSLEQALLRMELVEHYAHILFIAKSLGPLTPLSSTEMATLLDARAKASVSATKTAHGFPTPPK
jgi:L-fuculose-phosphate aldolase